MACLLCCLAPLCSSCFKSIKECCTRNCDCCCCKREAVPLTEGERQWKNRAKGLEVKKKKKAMKKGEKKRLSLQKQKTEILERYRYGGGASNV